MWPYKVFILLLVIQLSGCTPFENREGERVDSEGVEAVINSKPEKSLINTPENPEFAEKSPDDAHSHSGFEFDNSTSAPLTTTIITAQVCSPLASVPFEVLSSVVSDAYDPPLMGKDDRHQGTDFAYYRRFDRISIAGDVVQSVFKGRIAGVGDDRFPYGKVVIIETPYDLLSAEIQQLINIHENQSIYTLYGHLESFIVQKISIEVSACQPVGIVGKTGNAGVEHLHLEMRIGPANRDIQTMGYYVPEVTAAEREAYLLWRTSGTYLHFDPMEILDIAP